MVATVIVEQIVGAAPGDYYYKDNANAKSGTRYMTSDQWNGTLTTYPIPIPTALNGISGSYWVTHCINCTVAPDTYLKDLRYYQTWTTDPKTDWKLGSGQKAGELKPGLYIGVSSASVANAKIYTQGFPSSSYEQATGSEGTFGYYISAATNGLTWYNALTDSAASGGMISITNFDSLANAFMVQSGQIVGAATGRSFCIATQVIVGSGAAAGDKADKTATFVFSEA
jgi:hypothetical protein